MSDMNFTTKVDLMYSKDGWDSEYNAKVDIKWSLELEARSYGIKSFIVTVPEQDIHFSIVKEGLGEEDDYPEDITIRLTTVAVGEPGEWTGTFAPSALNFYKDKWRLEF